MSKLWKLKKCSFAWINWWNSDFVVLCTLLLSKLWRCFLPLAQLMFVISVWRGFWSHPINCLSRWSLQKTVWRNFPTQFQFSEATILLKMISLHFSVRLINSQRKQLCLRSPPKYDAFMNIAEISLCLYIFFSKDFFSCWKIILALLRSNFGCVHLLRSKRPF